MFEGAARHLNSALADHEFNVTQPAISRTISGLKDPLGATLLRRSTEARATQVRRVLQSALLLARILAAKGRTRRHLQPHSACGAPSHHHPIRGQGDFVALIALCTVPAGEPGPCLASAVRKLSNESWSGRIRLDDRDSAGLGLTALVQPWDPRKSRGWSVGVAAGGVRTNLAGFYQRRRSQPASPDVDRACALTCKSPLGSEREMIHEDEVQPLLTHPALSMRRGVQAVGHPERKLWYNMTVTVAVFIGGVEALGSFWSVAGRLNDSLTIRLRRRWDLVGKLAYFGCDLQGERLLRDRHLARSIAVSVEIARRQLR